MNSFFLKRKNNEDTFYSQIRDCNERAEAKEQIEYFWRIYRPYVQGKESNFLDKAQMKGYFKQCWWEMVLSVGLLNAEANIKNKNTEKGPDILIEDLEETSLKIYIEAIAPKEGVTEDKLPEMAWGYDITLPENKFLFRASGAFIEKHRKYKSYIKNNTICEKDIYIIAISACNLGEYGSLMDHPCPALFKFLVGAGNQVLSPKGAFVEYRPQIMKGDIPIEMNCFLKNKYNGISAVLYSNTNILGCPDKPEKTFIILSNPLAKNPLPNKIFKGIKIWNFDKKHKGWIKK
jgi:hypothetical protein